MPVTLTAEQRDMMRILSNEYGQPDRVVIERTPAVEGLLWLRWEISHPWRSSRNLFIKPDGSRLYWEPM